MPHHTDKEAKSVIFAFRLCNTNLAVSKHSSQFSVQCKKHCSASSANLCRTKILYNNTHVRFISIQKKDIFCIGDRLNMLEHKALAATSVGPY